MEDKKFQPPLKLFEPIVLIIKMGDGRLINSGSNYILKVKKLKERKVVGDFPLCCNIKLGNKIDGNSPSSLSLGTGFFIKENVIATAFHVLAFKNRYKNFDCSNIRFVRYFNNNNNDIRKDCYGNFIIPSKYIYEPRENSLNANYFNYSSIGQDWALVEVKNKKNDDFDPLKINSNEKIFQNKNDVWSIGHPLGLRANFSRGKIIGFSNKNDGIFKCDVNGLSGGSGSAIVDCKSGDVSGILIRADNHLKINSGGNCYDLENMKPPHGSEECQFIGVFADILPNIPVRKNKPLHLNIQKPKVLYNTCYFYLVNDMNKGKYHLFLLFPLGETDTIACTRGISTNGSINITCENKAGDENVDKIDEIRFAKYHFEIESNSLQSENETKEIVVHSYLDKNGEGISYREFTITIDDADEAKDNLEDSINNKLALNCPYMHLLRSKVIDQEGFPRYYPRVLLPTRGYELIKDSYKELIDTEFEISSVIELKPLKRSIISKLLDIIRNFLKCPISPQRSMIVDLNVNKKTFLEEKGSNGRFKVYVLRAENEGIQNKFKEMGHEDKQELAISRNEVDGHDTFPIVAGPRSMGAESTPSGGIFIDG